MHAIETSAEAKKKHPVTQSGGLPGLRDSEAARLMQGEKKTEDPNRFFAKEGVDPLTHAFEAKIAVHPGMGSRPVLASDRAEVLETVLAQPREGKSVAYIHVPFCETHCLYCGFFNKGYQIEQSREYADSLLKELALWQDKPVQQEGPIHAVYFGGGTPTALRPEDINRILKGVREYLPLANDCEITIEGRSSNLTRPLIEACLDGGANRFSLGVQSFQTHIRQAMGRRSTQEQLIERLGLLQSYDQAAVIIDLIYGFPMQTMELWLEDIAIAQSLELDGADCYQLNTYKSTPLGKAVESGKLPAGADIPGQGKMFEAGVAAMEQAFYRRLSISHWGRTPRERNIYNQYVKSGANIFAFGPGAGGTLSGYSYFNNPDYDTWRKLLEEKRKPMAMLTYPRENAQLFSAFSENMEQGRLDLPKLERDYKLPLTEILSPLLNQWEKAGVVRRFGPSWVLTLAGQFWQVNLSQALLGWSQLFAKEIKE